MKRYSKFFFCILSLAFSSLANAQKVDTTFAQKQVDYITYMALVGQHNLAYATEAFHVNIAAATIETAKIFPDPELTFGWSDNGQRRMNMGYEFESALTWTLELGGKRKARIDVAKNEAELTRLLLINYFHNLRADATLAFLLAIQNRLLTEVQFASYKQMKQLAKSDSARFVLGDISLIDALQSKLEAGTRYNAAIASEAEWKASMANLSLLLGRSQNQTLISPQGDLSRFERHFLLQDLLMEAAKNRADLRAAMQNKNVSQSLLKLAKANRTIDLGLSLGANYASYVRNPIAPTPSFTSVKTGVSLPLKFSNRRMGELKVAQYEILQAEQEYKQAELSIQTEVVKAYYEYLGAQKQVRQFDSGLLAESKEILEGKVYSYQRGETSLLEVLNAQRTYNEVQQNYYETLYNQAATLVELERAVGIWDINF